MTGIGACFQLDWPGFSLDVDLKLPGRGVTVLFGPSGSGKTTLLRCLGGLERAPQGRLTVNGEVWQDAGCWIPPYKRPLGYVFQEASLFTHLSVMGNLRYGMKRISDAQRVSLDHAVELLGIGHLLDRSPGRLSGGERQRVAIARALLTSPRLLLMDEPLSALDYQRKQEILPYLERLQRELDIPIIYVSHAIEEVVRLADHLVLLDQGRVIAAGAPTDTLSRLDLPATFADEASVVLAAHVEQVDPRYHLAQLAFADGQLWLPAGRLTSGASTRVRIHARDVSITLSAHDDSSILNRLPAHIESFAPLADTGHMLIRCRVGTTPVIARITLRSFEALAIRTSQTVWLQIKAVSLV